MTDEMRSGVDQGLVCRNSMTSNTVHTSSDGNALSVQVYRPRSAGGLSAGFLSPGGVLTVGHWPEDAAKIRVVPYPPDSTFSIPCRWFSQGRAKVK